MKIVVGLGNPGRKYRDTRHNLGFWAVEEFLLKQGWTWSGAECDSRLCRGVLAGEEILIAEPGTYMNASGRAVACLLDRSGSSPQDLLVVCDDAALALGTLRLRASGSDGGHRGLRSIAEAVGSESFPRLRIGIGAGSADAPLEEHVLSAFPEAQREAARQAARRAAECVETALQEGIEVAMNRFNRRSEGEPPEPAAGRV